MTEIDHPWETILMPKRNLRIVKRTPIALSTCESCNMQFQSRQPVEDDAEREMREAFQAHKCRREDGSQTAARVAREATEETKD